MSTLRRLDGAAMEPTMSGNLRVDRKTKQLLLRIQPGEIAVIDHADLDRAAAEALIAKRPLAVVNASPSTTGRYPNKGPLLLARAGIAVIDAAGGAAMLVKEGATARVVDADLIVDGRVIATGVRQTEESLSVLHEMAKERLGEELGKFAENTLEYLRRERHVLLERPPAPDLGVDMRGRHVLVVVRGNSTEADLAELRPYINEIHPVLIGVDGGADALLRARLVPDIILGDFDSASEAALRSGARLVVHAYPGGEAPGAPVLIERDLPHVLFESPGVSEDAAMLLAWELGAELIVAVGTHASMEEFLDKGRAGMASTFLTRLMLGSQLVDAKGVSRLYASRIRKRDLFGFVAAAMLVFVVMLLFFPQTRLFVQTFWFLLTEKLRGRG